jgi:dihydropyrimidinase
MITVIRNGIVVGESEAVKADILIEGGKVTRLDSSISNCPPAESIDASGKIVFPGRIDVHTHIQWGYLENSTADTFAVGTAAAARGGVTTIIDFALQIAGLSPLEALAERRSQVEEQSFVDYSFHLMLTNVGDNALKEIPKAISLGYPSYKLFMAHSSVERVASLEDIAKLLRIAKGHNGIIGIHAEKNEIVQRQTESLISQGKKALCFFPLSRPEIAETEAIREAIQITKETMSPLYVFHLTNAKGLQQIVKARFKGVPVFAETCLHHLFFTEESYGREDGSMFLVNPPLRRKRDIEALWKGLKEEKIQVVSSDHCAFTLRQKNEADVSFTRAPAGIPSIEPLFSVFYTEAVRRGLALPAIANLLSTNPARIFGLYPEKGAIRHGADADLVIYDPNGRYSVGRDDLHMGSDFSPYDGFLLKGRIERTILRGNTIFAEGAVSENRDGQFVPRFITTNSLH